MNHVSTINIKDFIGCINCLLSLDKLYEYLFVSLDLRNSEYMEISI